MELVLVRHGETQWNAGEIFRGRADVELNETGRRQALLVGEYLADSPIDAVHSSPLKRALETASAIAGHHGDIVVHREDRLCDLDFGEWEGLTVPEVRRRYPDAYDLWQTHPELLMLPGGETLDDVGRRALSFVNEAVSGDSRSIVMVTHRVVFKVLVCALLGLDNSHFWSILVDTCGVTTFSVQHGRFVLVRHNDTAFKRNLPPRGPADF